MNTFSCPDQCPEFCSDSKKKEYLFKVSKLYALNNSESALVAESPKDMLTAYLLSWEAEKLCSKQYLSSQTNDESDACRHYVWAHLLIKEFNREFSEKVLYAHESEPDQPIEEKAMDLANNNRGLSQAEKRIREKTFSENAIVPDFEKDLETGKIVVLKKRNSKVEVVP